MQPGTRTITIRSQLCTDDVEWHDPSLPGPGHGAGVIAGLMETLVRACPDIRFDETESAVPAPGSGGERFAVLLQRVQARRLRRSAAG
jgi:hypothetical protein